MYINQTKAESIETINDMFQEQGLPALTEAVLTSDWGIIGGETNAQLQEWVNDYASDLQTELNEEKNYYRYQP